MKKHVRIGAWVFELVGVRARKVDVYGKPFTSTASITITDGEPHVEGVISREKLSREDSLTLEKFCSSLGFDGYTCSHFENGERITTRIPLEKEKV